MASSVPVIANGKWYPSLSDAARAEGCSKSTMHRRLAKKKGYRYAGYADVDSLIEFADQLDRSTGWLEPEGSEWVMVKRDALYEVTDFIRKACGVDE